MIRIRNVIFKIDRYLCYIACVAICCCLGIVTVHVLMRVLFNSAVAGLTDYVGLITVVSIAMAIPWVESVKGHIKVDFVREYLPVKAQRAIYTIVEFVTNAVIIILVWSLIDYSIRSYNVGSMTWVVYIKFWPFVVMAVIGILFYFLSSLVNYICEIASWDRKGEEA